MIQKSGDYSSSSLKTVKERWGLGVISQSTYKTPGTPYEIVVNVKMYDIGEIMFDNVYVHNGGVTESHIQVDGTNYGTKFDIFFLHEFNTSTKLSYVDFHSWLTSNNHEHLSEIEMFYKVVDLNHQYGCYYVSLGTQSAENAFTADENNNQYFRYNINSLSTSHSSYLIRVRSGTHHANKIILNEITFNGN